MKKQDGRTRCLTEQYHGENMNTTGPNEENQLEPNSNCSAGLDLEATAKLHIPKELIMAILPFIGMILGKLFN